MADQKVSDLPSLNGADVDAADLLYIVDSSAGTAGSKKITIGQYQLAPVSGGTANGVVYLNASKVLTSGSALTFDGTNFATTGTVTATKLVPTGNVTAGNGMYLPAANTLAWSTNGAEGMRLDTAGNLGLGVAPSAWRASQTAIQFGSTGGYAVLGAGYATNVMVQVGANHYTNSAGNSIYIANNVATNYAQVNGVHAWYTAPSGTAGNAISFTQAMTLDASGNLGIGTTSPTSRLTIGSGAFSAAASGTTGLYTAASGGNVGYLTILSEGLDFSTRAGVGRLTLDSSGNLGLGVTPVAYTANARTFQLDGGANSAQIRLTNNTTGTAQTNGGLLSMDGNQLSVWNVENDALRFGTNDTERARITSGGDLQSYGAVSIWPSSSGGAGSYSIKRAATNALAITDDFAGQECLRIASGGDLLVGTTGNYSGNSAKQTICYPGSGSQYGITLNAVSTANTTAIAFLVGGTTAGVGGTAVGSISCTSTTTAYNTSSDYRLKDNPQPLTNSGAFIDALKPKTWEWKTDGSRGVGFIAHEAQAVSPTSVVGEKDAVDEDGKPIMQAMEYGSAEFIANIIAELQSLRARVAALEAA